MQVTINGQKETLQESAITVTQLLKIKNVDMPDMVSVELNGSILERANFETTPINDGDDIEFLYFMGGGVR